MSDAFLQRKVGEAARQRSALHNGHATQRVLSDGYDEVGLAGEFEFGKFIGQMPDLTDRPAGDKGVDFRLYLEYTVDVKTARKARFLLHEEGKPLAGIYVLVAYDDESHRASLVGWTWGRLLAQAPTKDFGAGFQAHYIAARHLRPMADLKRMMAPVQPRRD